MPAQRMGQPPLNSSNGYFGSQTQPPVMRQAGLHYSQVLSVCVEMLIVITRVRTLPMKKFCSIIATALTGRVSEDVNKCLP